MLISKFHGGNIKMKIEELEKQYSITLPSQYVNFLCRYNGGDTPNTRYRQGDVAMSIRGFYGFGDVRYSIDALDNLSEWVRKGLFPIACDYNGNSIAISIAEDRTCGNIYFIDHEAGDGKSFVVVDLKSFIQKCQSEKIKEASKRSIREREEALIAKGRGHIITDALRQMWQTEIDKYGNMLQEEVVIEE